MSSTLTAAARAGRKAWTFFLRRAGVAPVVTGTPAPSAWSVACPAIFDRPGSCSCRGAGSRSRAGACSRTPSVTRAARVNGAGERPAPDTVPGIQSGGVAELVDHDAALGVRSRGVLERLQVCPEALALLERKGIPGHVLPAEAAVGPYNELADAAGRPCGPLDPLKPVHSGRRALTSVCAPIYVCSTGDTGRRAITMEARFQRRWASAFRTWRFRRGSWACGRLEGPS
jgi:hypothetical protein